MFHQSVSPLPAPLVESRPPSRAHVPVVLSSPPRLLPIVTYLFCHVSRHDVHLGQPNLTRTSPLSLAAAAAQPHHASGAHPRGRRIHSAATLFASDIRRTHIAGRASQVPAARPLSQIPGSGRFLPSMHARMEPRQLSAAPWQLTEAWSTDPKAPSIATCATPTHSAHGPSGTAAAAALAAAIYPGFEYTHWPSGDGPAADCQHSGAGDTRRWYWTQW